MVILRLRFFIRREADKLVIFQQLRFRDEASTAYLCKAIARADGEKANSRALSLFLMFMSSA